ncbi:MAG: GNAT family N-acetyltransferase [Clostridia bacterium]|nr:GNAT family N-acetyltransferase [Clostridia bacterium]
MIDIQQENECYDDLINKGFNSYARKNGVECDYKSFSFVARENDKIVGILTGYSYYGEMHIDNVFILDNYRNKGIGSKLIQKVEERSRNEHLQNINLCTYEFQAPEFYKKCGFKIEMIRKNKTNPKLTKYFFIKYL